MPIRVLPPEIAARIAAGEVVERPASAVKELVENALDAGARRVSIEADGGGLTLIRVSDDGAGIPAQELELAFHRHATGKLPEGAALSAVATLGFRGEALPSIAAVAEVEAVSRPPEASIGAFVRLREAEVRERGARGAPSGTTISVYGLFRRQPARLKFLRSPAAEAGQIAAVVSNYALAYPEVRFTLLLDGREAFATSGGGDRREAVAGVYGPAVAAAMLDLREHADGRVLEAVIAPPQISRANRGYITIFVNRRWVRSRSLAFAVEEAYRGLLPAGRFPIAVIDVRLPPEEVDVNVHPAKAEVRLRDDRAIFALVQRPLRHTLAAQAPQAGLGAWALQGAAAPTPWSAGFATSAEEANGSGPPALYGPAPAAQPAVPESAATQAPLPSRLPLLRPLGQAGITYVIAEGPAGVYLIDQHAAHERVLFERIRAQRLAAPAPAQGLLAPVALELTPAQASLLTEMAAPFAALGFEVEAFGRASGTGLARGHLLRSAPPLLRGDPARAFLEVLDLLTRDDGPSDPLDRVVASLACHGALRAGQALTEEEMRDLVRQLEACEAPQTCPHGRPTAVHLSADELARRFGRR